MNRILLACVALLIFSCGSPPKEKAMPVERLAQQPKRIRTDTVDVLYFKKPFTDPERYTRFFSVARTVDTAFTTALAMAVDGPGQRNEKPRDCFSEGKIIVPMGGDAFKVYYYSRKASNCPYVYLIRDGEFYYYEMPAKLDSMLTALERSAKEPG